MRMINTRHWVKNGDLNGLDEDDKYQTIFKY